MPLAPETVEHLAAFLGRQHGVGEQLGAAQNVFVLGQQCGPEHGLVSASQTFPYHGTPSAAAPQERGDQYIGIQHDRDHAV